MLESNSASCSSVDLRATCFISGCRCRWVGVEESGRLEKWVRVRFDMTSFCQTCMVEDVPIYLYIYIHIFVLYPDFKKLLHPLKVLLYDINAGSLGHQSQWASIATCQSTHREVYIVGILKNVSNDSANQKFLAQRGAVSCRWISAWFLSKLFWVTWGCGNRKMLIFVKRFLQTWAY